MHTVADLKKALELANNIAYGLEVTTPEPSLAALILSTLPVVGDITLLEKNKWYFVNLTQQRENDEEDASPDEWVPMKWTNSRYNSGFRFTGLSNREILVHVGKDEDIDMSQVRGPLPDLGQLLKQMASVPEEKRISLVVQSSPEEGHFQNIKTMQQLQAENADFKQENHELISRNTDLNSQVNRLKTLTASLENQLETLAKHNSQQLHNLVEHMGFSKQGYSYNQCYQQFGNCGGCGEKLYIDGPMVICKDCDGLVNWTSCSYTLDGAEPTNT